MFSMDFFSSHQIILKRKNRGKNSNYSHMDTKIGPNWIIHSFLKHILVPDLHTCGHRPSWKAFLYLCFVRSPPIFLKPTPRNVFLSSLCVLLWSPQSKITAASPTLSLCLFWDTFSIRSVKALSFCVTSLLILAVWRQYLCTSPNRYRDSGQDRDKWDRHFIAMFLGD